MQRLFHPEPVRGAVSCCKGTMIFASLKNVTISSRQTDTDEFAHNLLNVIYLLVI